MTEQVTETTTTTPETVETPEVTEPVVEPVVESAGASDDSSSPPSTVTREEVSGIVQEALTEARKQWAAEQAKPEQETDSQAAVAEPTEQEVHPDTNRSPCSTRR